MKNKKSELEKNAKKQLSQDEEQFIKDMLSLESKGKLKFVSYTDYMGIPSISSLNNISENIDEDSNE